MGCHYAREHVHIPLLYLGNGWTDCAQICYVSRDPYDMWLRQCNWGVSARAQLHTPPLFRCLGLNRVIQASRLMIAEFLEVTFSRHGTCKLLCDTSFALARSSPTRRYTARIGILDWCRMSGFGARNWFVGIWSEIFFLFGDSAVETFGVEMQFFGMSKFLYQLFLYYLLQNIFLRYRSWQNLKKWRKKHFFVGQNKLGSKILSSDPNIPRSALKSQDLGPNPKECILLRASAKREASFCWYTLKIWVWAADWPAGRGHAFERLISLEP